MKPVKENTLSEGGNGGGNRGNGGWGGLTFFETAGPNNKTVKT